MKHWIFILLLFIPLISKADYDSLFCIAEDQIFISRENVANDDVIGVWMQNYTYLGSTASFSIQTNWNNAFKFNGDTIAVNDYTQFEFTADTTIKLLIKSTADGTTEYDTAFIYFKEENDCNLNPSAATMDNPTIGDGYFFERGNVYTGYGSNWQAIIATTAKKTMVGAYGRGARPVFDGEDTESNFLYLGDDEDIDQEANRCVNVMISDIEAHNYREHIVKIKRTSDSIYMLNFWFHNGDIIDQEAIISFNTQTLDDTTATYYARFQNFRLDTAGYDCSEYCEHSGLKVGAGAVEVINGYFGFMGSDGCAYRPCAGHHHTGKHLYFAGETTSFYPMQIRCDSSFFQDIIFEDYSGGSMVAGLNYSGNDEYGTTCDSIILNNIYIRNCNMDAGIYAYRATDYNPLDDIYISDFLFKGNTFSNADIYLDGIRTVHVERGRFEDTGVKILCTDDAALQDVHINYCVAFNAVDEEFTLDGDTVYVYNNTVDGEVNNSLCAHDTVRYCYLETLTGELFVEDTLNIDSHEDDFTNYAGNDYSLVEGADGVDAGSDWGQTQDIIGNSQSGLDWDIGAYEYQETGIRTATYRGISISNTSHRGMPELKVIKYRGKIYE